MERKYPFYIRGSKDNPDGVLLALYEKFPDDIDINHELFNEYSGYRSNAGNEDCIFYYNEFNKNNKIRLLDECDGLAQEWISSSTEWHELKPISKSVIDSINRYHWSGTELESSVVPDNENISLAYQDLKGDDTKSSDNFRKDLNTYNENVISLDELEYYRYLHFKEDHEHSEVAKGTIPYGIQIEFNINSVARNVIVKCPYCGEKADITNYNKW